MATTTLDGHLASCADCAGWAEDAARVTRLTRMDARPVPDVSAQVTAKVALPARQVTRRRRWLRGALLLVGLAQFGVGLPAVIGQSIGMTMSAHAAHEGAAWNLAIGAAFVAVAFLPRRAAGLIPLLATFLLVLGALSVRDLVAGSVGIERLATHAVALAGLLLLVLLDRAERALPPGRWHASLCLDGDADGDTTLRTVA